MKFRYDKIQYVFTLILILLLYLMVPGSFAGESSLNPYDKIAKKEQTSEFLETIEGNDIESGDNYKATIKRLLDLKHKNPQFDFKIWSDRENYNICIPQACDKVKIFVQLEKPGYLYLFDIDPNGDLWMLIPNDRMRKSNFIQKGEFMINIPNDHWNLRIKMQKPQGLHRIKAIITPEPIEWSNWGKNKGLAYLRKSNEKGLRDLSLNLNRLLDLYSGMVTASGSFFISYQVNKAFFHDKDMQIPQPEKPIDIIGTTGREEEFHE